MALLAAVPRVATRKNFPRRHIASPVSTTYNTFMRAPLLPFSTRGALHPRQSNTGCQINFPKPHPTPHPASSTRRNLSPVIFCSVSFDRPTDLLLDSTSARGRRSESSLSLRRRWEKRLFLGGGLKAEGLFSLPSQCL